MSDSITKSKIATAITKALPEHSIFKPTGEFYKALNINKHRFAKLMKGQADPLLSELLAIAAYFKVEISELI